MSGDFTQMALLVDLMDLQRGRFKNRSERKALARSAFEAVSYLEQYGGFVGGNAKLAEIKTRLQLML